MQFACFTTGHTQPLKMKTQLARTLLLATLLCTSCQNTFKKYDAGLHYRIVHIGDGEKIQPGQTMKLQLKQIYQDSVLINTMDSLPYYQRHDSTMISTAAYKIFGQLTKGDSVIFKALTDSLFKNKLPAFAKRNEYLYTHVYVQDILYAHEDPVADLQREMERKGKRATKQ